MLPSKNPPPVLTCTPPSVAPVQNPPPALACNPPSVAPVQNPIPVLACNPPPVALVQNPQPLPVHITIPDDDPATAQNPTVLVHSPPTCPNIYRELQSAHDNSNGPLWMDSSFPLNSTNPPTGNEILHTSLDGLLPGGMHLSSTPIVSNRSGKKQITMEKLERNQQVIMNYLKHLAEQQDFMKRKLDLFIGHGYANHTNMSSVTKLPNLPTINDPTENVSLEIAPKIPSPALDEVTTSVTEESSNNIFNLMFTKFNLPKDELYKMSCQACSEGNFCVKLLNHIYAKGGIAG